MHTNIELKSGLLTNPFSVKGPVLGTGCRENQANYSPLQGSHHQEKHGPTQNEIKATMQERAGDGALGREDHGHPGSPLFREMIPEPGAVWRGKEESRERGRHAHNKGTNRHEHKGAEGHACEL